MFPRLQLLPVTVLIRGGFTPGKELAVALEPVLTFGTMRRQWEEYFHHWKKIPGPG